VVATGWVSCLAVSRVGSIEALVLPIGVIVGGGGDSDLIRILLLCAHAVGCPPDSKPCAIELSW
jgi:hypothetical protein